MARSLTVKHEEKLGTSSLLNSFLLVTFAWMIAGAVFAGSADASAAADAGTPDEGAAGIAGAVVSP